MNKENLMSGLGLILVSSISILLLYSSIKKDEKSWDENIQGEFRTSHARLDPWGTIIALLPILLLGIVLVYNELAYFFDWQTIPLP